MRPYHLTIRTLKHFSCGAVLAALAAGVWLPRQVHAQDDYFRELESPREIAPVVQLNPQQDEHYNLAVGPVRINAAAGVGMEWNDNIALSDHNRQSDWILRPSVNLDAVWQLSDLNTLRFSLGLSYAKYFNHSQYDTRGLLVSPNSELALTVLVGQVTVTLRDRFSYQEDPYDIPTVSNQVTFRRFENMAGIQADYDMNPYVHLAAGYDHYNVWIPDNSLSEGEHAIDTVFLRPAYKISPTVTVGADASGSYISYNGNTFDDGWSILVGPYIDWAITESTRFYVEGGYQDFLDEGGGAASSTTGDKNSYYVKAELDNRLTDYFNHRLSFSKTIEAGYTSQYYELWHVEYAADWKLTPSLVVDPVLFYEHYKASGVAPEEGDRFGTDLGMRYVLTPSVTLGADYRFIVNNSNLPDSSYYQNLVLLSLFYNF